MKIGLVSDTHDFFEPRLPEVFTGVDHILHAGDIGRFTILQQLERIAPVTAVLGNNDAGLPVPAVATVAFGQLKFVVQHIVSPHAVTPALKARLDNDRPHGVVFGHSHKKFSEMLGGVLFVNPGYAGRTRFGQPRSVAILHASGTTLRLEFIDL